MKDGERGNERRKNGGGKGEVLKRNKVVTMVRCTPSHSGSHSGISYHIISYHIILGFVPAREGGHSTSS